jgi:hypothetical protein
MKIVTLEKPELFIAGYGLYSLYPHTTVRNVAVQCYNITKMNVNFVSYQKIVLCKNYVLQCFSFEINSYKINIKVFKVALKENLFYHSYSLEGFSLIENS